MNSVFPSDPGEQGSIPGRIILKSPKMILDVAIHNTQHWKVRIKLKWINHGKVITPSPTPWCCSYWKRSLRVTFDYGRQLTLHAHTHTHTHQHKHTHTHTHTHIYIYIYVCVCGCVCMCVCVCVCLKHFLDKIRYLDEPEIIIFPLFL